MWIPISPEDFVTVIERVESGELSELNGKKLLGFIIDNNIKQARFVIRILKYIAERSNS